MARPRGPGRRPALVPIPVGGLSLPPRELPLAAPTLWMAFGRRKDSKSEDDEDGGDAEAADESSEVPDESGADRDQLPPIPSALGAGDVYKRQC